MDSNNKIWGTLLKVSLGLILVLSFLQVKMKYGWNPFDSCFPPPDSILIESITLSDSVMNIEANKTQNLLAQIEPADATNQNLIWSSSDTTVAIVDPTTGRVTATGKGGECIITAAATDDSGKSDTIKIKVKKEKSDSIILVNTITFQNSKDVIILNSGSNFRIDAMPLPEKATNKILKWKSDNEGVATVNNGVVTGKDVGVCTITASSTDGSNVVKSIKVRVQEPITDIKVSSISFDKTTLTVSIGDREQIVAKILPAEATNKTLKWRSDKEGVATVSNGIVIGRKAGECTITASSTDGGNVVKSIKVRVQEPITDIKVSSISFDKTTLTVSIGDREQIVAKILPAEATNKTLKWRSDKEGVATVSNGIVIGRKAGECTITASSTDGGNVVKSIKVRVQEPDDGLDGKTIEEKVKYYLSYFSNSTNTTSKKAKAKDMDSLFAPDALIIIKNGSVRQKEQKSRIGIWASSRMKIRYISHKVNTSGLITELTVEENL